MPDAKAPVALNARDRAIFLYQQHEYWLLPALLVLFTFIALFPCLGLYFVRWDDTGYIIDNPALAGFDHTWSWQAISDMFTSEAGANYDPLPIATFAIEKYLFAHDPQQAPFIYHLDNLLLHLGCTLGVYILLVKLGIRNGAAFIGALLFGIHPMRVESVAWVTERKDVLYGLFYILALITYVNFVHNGKRKWYLWTIVLALLSCFSKVQAVCLPLSMVAIDYLLGRKWYMLRTLFFEKLPWWLMSVVFGFINLYYLSAHDIINTEGELVNYNIADKIALGAYTYFTYLAKFIYPYKMIAYYSYPTVMPPAAYSCLALVPLGLGVLIWKHKQNKNVLFGLAFFTVNIMFMLQILSVGKAYMADRFTYIAYLGLFFIVAKGYEWGTTKLPPIMWGIMNMLVTLYLLLLGVTTYNQTKVWTNSITLWKHQVNAEKNNQLGYLQLGSYYLEKVMGHNVDPFIPKNDSAYLRAAVKALGTAVQLDSADGRPLPERSMNILLDHGVACGATGRQDSNMYYLAVKDFTTVNALYPRQQKSFTDRAMAYMGLNKYASALADLDTSLQIGPPDPMTFHKKATCEDKLGRPHEALADLDHAIQMAPGIPFFYVTRAEIHKELNDTAASRQDAIHARQLGASLPPDL